MFSKHNIQSIRFSNPQNDTVHIVYEDNGANTNYWFPVIPYNSYEWSIVREAGYDMESIFRNTLEWVKTHETVYKTIAQCYNK